MVSTERGFSHILSLRQLAEQVKRVSNRAKRHNYSHKLDNLMKTLNKSIQETDSDEVRESLKDIFPKFGKEEKWLELILENELIILRGKENTEHKENKIHSVLEKLSGKLSNKDIKKLNNSNHDLKEFENNMVKDTEIIRGIIEDIVKGEFANAHLRLAKLFNVGTDKMKERAMSKSGHKEYKDLKEEEKIKKVENLLHELSDKCNEHDSNSEDLTNKINELVKVQKIVMHALEDGLKRAYTIILQDLSLYINFLKLYSELHKDIEILIETGFSPDFMAKVIIPWDNKEKKQFKEFFDQLGNQIIELERGAQAEKVA